MAIAYSVHLELCNKNKAIGSSGNQQQTKGKLAANIAQQQPASSLRCIRSRSRCQVWAFEFNSPNPLLLLILRHCRLSFPLSFSLLLLR